MLFKTETVVDTIVDAFQDAAACIAALPEGTVMRCRNEEAPILLRDINADNASIVARIYLSGGVAIMLLVIYYL